MSTSRKAQVGRSPLQKASTYLTAFLIALSATAIGVSPAQSLETTLSGYQDLNTVVNWNTYRINSFQANKVSIRVTNAGNGGGLLVIGLRNPAGTQFASASSSVTGAWKSLLTNTGNPAIPPGGFYINSRVTGSQGACPCTASYWATGFRWNIQYL